MKMGCAERHVVILLILGEKKEEIKKKKKKSDFVRNKCCEGCAGGAECSRQKRSARSMRKCLLVKV